jgi:hypothetical protein
VGVAGLGEVEEVGCVPSGLLSLSLSPDSELVTLVTADHKLIIMTRDYTPLSETSIQQEWITLKGISISCAPRIVS